MPTTVGLYSNWNSTRAGGGGTFTFSFSRGCPLVGTLIENLLLWIWNFFPGLVKIIPKKMLFRHIIETRGRERESDEFTFLIFPMQEKGFVKSKIDVIKSIAIDTSIYLGVEYCLPLFAIWMEHLLPFIFTWIYFTWKKNLWNYGNAKIEPEPRTHSP